MSLDDALPSLDRLAQAALSLWDLPRGARVRLINVSENVTYRVEHEGTPLAVLRVHRVGYHSLAAIRSELDWLSALRADRVLEVPSVIPGRNGAAVQAVEDAGAGELRHLVMFEHLAGEMPDESVGAAARFEELGELAARCHLHVQGWQRPAGFERLSWDLPAVFGPAPHWGDWRDAPHLAEVERKLLERVEVVLERRLTAYGQVPDRYGLIHADMRLANLLVTPEKTRVIDFDDCGFGWFLYDFAAAVSFIEEDPRLQEWQAAWLRGYQRVRPLSEADRAELPSLIMLRRMALLAWIGSHIEAPEPQALAPHFAAGTARLGAAYLAQMEDT